MKLPPVNRTIHGNSLKKQLDRAWRELVARDERHGWVAVDARQGVYLEFASAPSFELALHSLDVKSLGIELAATRTRNDVSYATVYVPQGKLGHFEKRIEEYLVQSTPKGNPKNKSLIESIAEIRLAVLEGFWTDEPALFPAVDKSIWWEVWLRGDNGEALPRFREYARRAGLKVGDKHLEFPDRCVVLVHASREQMTG